MIDRDSLDENNVMSVCNTYVTIPSKTQCFQRLELLQALIETIQEIGKTAFQNAGNLGITGFSNFCDLLARCRMVLTCNTLATYLQHRVKKEIFLEMLSIGVTSLF